MQAAFACTTSLFEATTSGFSVPHPTGYRAITPDVVVTDVHYEPMCKACAESIMTFSGESKPGTTKKGDPSGLNGVSQAHVFSKRNAALGPRSNHSLADSVTKPSISFPNWGFAWSDSNGSLHVYSIPKGFHLM